MTKVLVLLAAIGLLFLLLGVYLFPASSAFWLASMSGGYQAVRAVLAGLLLIDLATNPPRSRVFRALSIMVAVAVGTWVLRSTYANNMQLLDSLSLLGASFAIAVTALELRPIKSQKITDVVHQN